MSFLRTTPDEYLPGGATRLIQYTGVEEIDALLGRAVWDDGVEGTLVLSYSFIREGSRFDESSEEAEQAIALPGWVQELVRQCLLLIEAYVDIEFVEVVETPDLCGVIRFSGLRENDEEFAAFAFMPSTGPWGGDVFLYEDQLVESNRDYLKTTILHEIGHALGLKHPFESESYNPRVLSPDFDQITMTLMSYTDVSGADDAYLTNYPESPMPLDVFALQALYGPSRKALGNDIYDLSEGHFDGFFALFDGGGVDTLDMSRLLSGATLNLTPNIWSDVGKQVWVTDGTYFSDTFMLVQTLAENVVGSAFDDVVYVNDQNNEIRLGAGFDVVRWEAALSNFELDFQGGAWIVKERDNLSHIDQFVEVERFEFLDRTIEVATTPHDGFSDLPPALYQFFIVAFSAAPGVTYLSQLAEAYRHGLSVRDIVNIFVSKAQFTDVYPEGLTTAQLSERLVTNIVKGSATEEVRAEAISDLKEAFEYGLTRGDVIYTVFGNLAKMPLSDPKWGKTASLFSHQLEVAKYYSEVMNQSTTDLPTLRLVLEAVTSQSSVESEDDLLDLVIQGLTSSGDTPTGQAQLAKTLPLWADTLYAEVEPQEIYPWISPVALY